MTRLDVLEEGQIRQRIIRIANVYAFLDRGALWVHELLGSYDVTIGFFGTLAVGIRGKGSCLDGHRPDLS